VAGTPPNIEKMLGKVATPQILNDIFEKSGLGQPVWTEVEGFRYPTESACPSPSVFVCVCVCVCGEIWVGTGFETVSRFPLASLVGTASACLMRPPTFVASRLRLLALFG